MAEKKRGGIDRAEINPLKEFARGLSRREVVHVWTSLSVGISDAATMFLGEQLFQNLIRVTVHVHACLIYRRDMSQRSRFPARINPYA